MKQSLLQQQGKSERESLPAKEQVTYRIDGKTFVVQPVFKKDKSETIGAILVKLMRADIDP
jgi:hypothetical protein